MKTSTTTMNSVLCLSLLAGAAPAVAQMTPVELRAEKMSEQRTLSFLEASELLGSTVLNANNKEIGSIEDVVFERGTGRISHVVVHHGGILGFGGDRIAVPVDVVTMRRTTPHVRVHAAVTPESFERSRDIGLDNWIDIDDADENWLDQIEGDRLAQDVTHAADDPYLQTIKTGELRSVQGRITGVDRFETDNGGELIALTVDPTDGPERRVIIGPSWYVMSQPAAPMRGGVINLHAYELPRSTEHDFVASSYTMNGTKATLRESNGQPRWSTSRYNPNSGSDMTGVRTMALLTDIIGADADARWDDAGSIEGAIIELNSGRIAMLTLDPDENFLGIGDQLRCVPWSVVGYVGEDSVAIDADKDMLTSSRYTPSDITILTRPAQVEPVFMAYGVEPASFEPVTKSKSDASSNKSHRDFVKACHKGESFTLTGAVREVSTRNFDGLPASMSAVRVETPNGMKTILLGPDWFINQQSWKLSNGDQISIEGTTAKFQGKTYHVAQELKLPRNRGDVVLWDSNTPRWMTN